MSSKSSSAAPTASRWRKFALAPRGNSKALVPRLPPGFDHNTSTVVVQKLPARELAERKLRMQNMQCMAIAKKPFGSIFMIAFMCWITGASMHIFSIMQLFMVFSNAVSAILNTPAAFKNVGHPNPFKYYVIFIGIHLLTLAPAIYKAQMLGFVPYKSSHWTSILLGTQVPMESQAAMLNAF
eukprot:INCI14889.1.p1 GENE.INCI14889.1~~INCI14889.1.p1  ORF type:complete len:199 (+),score=27.74 INCI14889.1:53-598(+)